MLVRNAMPVSFWQSVQWQTLTVAGSTSASQVMCPQWHPPVIFIVTPECDGAPERLRCDLAGVKVQFQGRRGRARRSSVGGQHYGGAARGCNEPRRVSRKQDGRTAI